MVWVCAGESSFCTVTVCLPTDKVKRVSGGATPMDRPSTVTRPHGLMAMCKVPVARTALGAAGLAKAAATTGVGGLTKSGVCVATTAADAMAEGVSATVVVTAADAGSTTEGTDAGTATDAVTTSGVTTAEAVDACTGSVGTTVDG